MSYVRENVVIRTKRKELFVAAFVLPPFLACITMLLVGEIFDTLPYASVVTLAAGALLEVFLIVAILRAWSREWRAKEVELCADEMGVHVGGRLLLRRNRILHASHVRRGLAWFVRFERLLPAIEVEVDGEEDAYELLAAMRLDPARSVARYWFGSRGLPIWGELLLGGVLGAAAIGLSIALFGTALGALVLLIPSLVRALDSMHHVLVGADGVQIRRVFHRRRFIPYGSIRSVTAKDGDISMVLTNGEHIEMRHAPEQRWFRTVSDADRRESKSFVERVEERRRTVADGSGAVALTSRGGAPVDEWMRRLRVVADDHATFRDAAVPAEQLWTTVEDSRAPETARAGAAVALRAKLDDAGRARLRAIADSCAAPRLRVALETLSSTDDEAQLHQVLGELDDTHEQAPLRSRA